MNYNEMSDWEINHKAFLLGVRQGLFEFEDIMSKPNPDRSAIMYGDGANWFEWDGCNNASDAWSIIVENTIDIQFAEENLGGIGQISKYIEGNTDFIYEFRDNKRALRAAMIVFLMMNEGE